MKYEVAFHDGHYEAVAADYMKVEWPTVTFYRSHETAPIAIVSGVRSVIEESADAAVSPRNTLRKKQKVGA